MREKSIFLEKKQKNEKLKKNLYFLQNRFFKISQKNISLTPDFGEKYNKHIYHYILFIIKCFVILAFDIKKLEIIKCDCKISLT